MKFLKKLFGRQRPAKRDTGELEHAPNKSRNVSTQQGSRIVMNANQFLNDVLASGRIAFCIDDLSALGEVHLAGLPQTRDLYLYPRPDYPNEIGILYFTTTIYRRRGDRNETLTEKQYRSLPFASQQQYEECYEIHLTKATWERYKNNAPFLAQIVVDVYNQLFPHREVRVESLWSDRAKSMQISDVDLFFVDHAERTRNVEYLRRLSRGISQEEDPHGNLAKAAKEALRRLGHSGDARNSSSATR